MRDLAALPKAHLHVHLESTIRPDTLRELGEANGVDVPGEPPVFDGFRAFADYNALIRSCLRRPEDFERIAREYCEDELAQGTRYAEVTFTAASHGERLGDLEMPLASVLEGLSTSDLERRVVLDHSRRRSVGRAERTLELALKYDEVFAIGMAGEENHSLRPFATVFDRAREAGIHLLHHTGEDAGPDSIREALAIGCTERLGHGIRVLEDPALVAEVRERGLALEVCPSSNVTLGLVPSLPRHPLPRLVDAGLTVTLNTDVPSVTGANLAEEYARVQRAFGYDDAAMADFARAGVRASFAPAETKQRLLRGIDAWLTPAAGG
ncbi:adenosine deaminase [Amycolatopsis australiensis]|uniref:Adenosine deaminase n=1 Tax=Amycolatopsis australiensis TaxID=546364 RepID=A0A1K1RY87_9PSEU|nr:adenosine deaminase [Amycolatopsis australiensis]SFW76930.1 adenosine deaminase [Amycolatopsis australiensis]